MAISSPAPAPAVCPFDVVEKNYLYYGLDLAKASLNRTIVKEQNAAVRDLKQADVRAIEVLITKVRAL